MNNHASLTPRSDKHHRKEVDDLISRRAATLKRLSFNELLAFEITESDGHRHPQPVSGATYDCAAALLAHVGGPSVAAVSLPYRRGGRIRHLHGHPRLASYLPSPGASVSTFACIDIDGGEHHADALLDPDACMLDIIARLQANGIPAYPERSRSGCGWHLWTFYGSPQSANLIRQLLLTYVPGGTFPLRNGGVAEPATSRGIEIFPKVVTVRQDAYGSPIFLPWYHGDPEGYGEFYRIGAVGDLGIDPLPEFQFVPESVLQVQQKTLAVNPLTIQTTRISLPTPEWSVNVTSHTAPDWQAWWRQVRATIPLEDIYGCWLTGQSRGCWLECRDPFSPSGDRHPSGSIAADGPARGTFHSFRSGRSLDPAAFLVETGQCPNDAAALQHLATLAGIPLPPPRRQAGKRSVSSRVTSLPAPPPVLWPELTLTEARKELDRFIDDLHRDLTFGNRHPEVAHVGTGVGKTSEGALLARDIVNGTIRGMNGHPLRVLWLARTRQSIDELITTFFTTSTGALWPGVGVCEPRSWDPHSAGYCRKYTLAEQLAAKRQRVTATLCPDCERETEERQLPPCLYRQQWATLDNQTLVIGTHESYLLAAHPLTKFDLIIVDEGAAHTLIERVMITLSDVQQWESRAVHDPLWPLLAPVISALKRGLTAGDAEGLRVHRDGAPLLPVLSAITPGIEEQLGALMAALAASTNAGTQATPFDRVDGTTVENIQNTPLRALMDLLRTLVNVWDTEEGPHGAAWLLPAQGTLLGRIMLYLPRTGVITHLHSCLAVMLDATPPLTLLRHLFGPDLQVRAIPVVEHLHVTLFTDSLYTGLQPDTWPQRAIDRLVELICARHRKPLIISTKRHQQYWTERLPKHAQFTYYGAPDSRGSNQFADCDALVLIGHYRAPDAEFVRLASVLHGEDAKGQMTLYASGNPHQRAMSAIPLTGYADAEGRGAAFHVSYPADPLARQIAMEAYSADLLQLLGRLRASRPQYAAQPLPVYLVIGEPPAGVPIAEVTTLLAWLQAHDPEWVASHPAPPSYGGASNAATASKLQQANNQREQAAQEKVRAAVKRLTAAGKSMNLRAVAKEADVAIGTARKHLMRGRQQTDPVYQARTLSIYLKSSGLLHPPTLLTCGDLRRHLRGLTAAVYEPAIRCGGRILLPAEIVPPLTLLLAGVNQALRPLYGHLRSLYGFSFGAITMEVSDVQ
ncbi:MAG: TOTE conflict system archaeo-eukaryotic primase domain-containing protein [Armatimonadota bacterium]